MSDQPTPIIPPKLQPGDTIRVISPAISLAVIGRFQRDTKMTRELLTAMVRSKPALAHIPVVADASFGHTTPQFTFPVGGTGRLSATSSGVQFTIVEH